MRRARFPVMAETPSSESQPGAASLLTMPVAMPPVAPLWSADAIAASATLRILLLTWLGPSQEVVQQMQRPRWAAVHALNCAKTANTLAAPNQQNTCERRTHHANQDQQNNDGPHHS